MRLRCPVCHAEAALEAWVEDEAAREMMAILSALDAALGRPLVAYLGLWRSASRALAWERAVRIAREVLALEADAQRLAAALSQTVEQLRAKRDAGDVRPLTGHGYLKRVLEGMPQTAGALSVIEAQPQRSAAARAQAKGPSATVDGVMRLEALKRRARGEDGHE
jgi:hypothetical protein